MPNFFQLTRKSNPEAGPVTFIEIDDEMCKHFGVEPTECYYEDWYGTVGFAMACGCSLADIAQIYAELEVQDGKDYKLVEVIEWLRQNFTSDAWYEPKSA